MDSDTDFETPAKKFRHAVPVHYGWEEEKENLPPQSIGLQDKEKLPTRQEVIPVWMPSYGKTDGHGKVTYSFLLTKVLNSKTNTIEWLMDMGVLAKHMDCPTCDKPMRLVEFTGLKSSTDGLRSVI